MFRLFAPVLLVAVAVLAAAPASTETRSNGIIAADEAYRMVVRGDVVLLDIRSPQEWKQTGVPLGALTVTVHRKDFAEAVDAVVGGDKTVPIALICATGGRSAMARRFLRSLGYSAVNDVSEGMLGNDLGPGWLRRGQPVRRYAGP